MEKDKYRRKMKEQLFSISEEELERASIEICQKLTNLDVWKKAKNIGVTISIGKEIHTNLIIEKGWEQGKMISIPKTNPMHKEMDFYKILDYSQMEESYYGLKEPIVGKTSLVTSKEIDLLIIPCVAFDQSGYRIGYGGGYFDRYLANYKGITCGITLGCQQVEQVPTNEFDIPLDMIITEKDIYQFK